MEAGEVRDRQQAAALDVEPPAATPVSVEHERPAESERRLEVGCGPGQPADEIRIALGVAKDGDEWGRHVEPAKDVAEVEGHRCADQVRLVGLAEAGAKGVDPGRAGHPPEPVGRDDVVGVDSPPAAHET